MGFENIWFRGINFSDFAITCSIYLKMCWILINLILAGTTGNSENRAIC